VGLAYVSGMRSLRDVIGGNLQAVAVQAADRVTMLVQGEERASVLVDGPTVMSTHLPDRLQALADRDSVPAESASFKQAKQQAVESFERNFLIDLLKRNEGHMSNAAREAGVDRKTIERMVKKHGLRGMF